MATPFHLPVTAAQVLPGKMLDFIDAPVPFIVAVNTVIQAEKEFLNHIIKSTNMKCLTPLSALEGDCRFLAANLYAKRIFGEDALVNVSIEKQADGKLSGYIRIRSKTQGIALSLGDKTTLKQKGGS
ncbi:Coatomer subunit beta-1 [Camellia lanceoleosa]|uniref:Coatomer subunit beta-1 n=1 Tax=Camellia lanceoleosa TaxID=1840588 RepID=A0ACC0FWB7_9ERIC|nr:Coatomer subunit beta-1 [Camellia lanceoleosa]